MSKATDSAADPLVMVDAVVIGRNEGARLRACLTSLTGQVRRVVYVDSGSNDDSVAVAKEIGAQVIELDMSKPFTAARARNAGWRSLGEDAPDFVQFVDGDCVVLAGWVGIAAAELADRPELALVCGRRREIHPEISVYNRLCDQEWGGPLGEIRTCGGDVMIRYSALQAVDGYDPRLIAGEEPELCVRLRKAGWILWRLAIEMTRHDAVMTRFGQWWARSRRAGHAFAEGAHLHGKAPERHWVPETRRAVFWGLVLPILIAALSIVWPAFLAVSLVYPLQVFRLAAREGIGRRASWEWAFFTTLGKFAEASGILQFHLGRLKGRRAELIEYK